MFIPLFAGLQVDPIGLLINFQVNIIYKEHVTLTSEIEESGNIHQSHFNLSNGNKTLT